MASTRNAPDLLSGPIVSTLVRLAARLEYLLIHPVSAFGAALLAMGGLYGVIGLSFVVYALVPGVAFRLGAWSPEGKQTARG